MVSGPSNNVLKRFMNEKPKIKSSPMALYRCFLRRCIRLNHQVAALSRNCMRTSSISCSDRRSPSAASAVFASMFALENTPVDIPEFEVYFGFHSATEE
jgi:hypothetical protein